MAPRLPLRALRRWLSASRPALSLLFVTFLICVGESRRKRENALKEEDIVLANGGIQVPFGRSVFLDPELDMRIMVRSGDRCTIRVIQNDPLSQRPGGLTPKNFPCQFDRQEVQYSHFGSRSPAQDKIKLMIKYDSKHDTIIIPLVVTVDVLFEQLEIVTKNLPLSVEKLGGLSNPIDNRVLQFTYDKSSQVCKVAILTSIRDLPRHGELQNFTSKDEFHDCETFLQMDLRYQHTSPNSSPNRDFIPMVVELSDQAGDLLKQEYFQVMARIKEGEENTVPQLSFSALLLMDVKQFVMTAIIPNILIANDAETAPDDLIFNITSPLGYGEGVIVSTDDQNLPITSFYQKDLQDLKIAYKPPASDSDVRRFFVVEMEVVDSEGMNSEPFSLTIVVNPMNTLAPMATRNSGITLFEGQSRRLDSSNNLEISDEDNIDDVIVRVVGGLRHGRLLLSGRPVKEFSPADLDKGLVVYEHDGTDTYSDNIILRLDDGQHQVEFLFPVTIHPEDDTSPFLNVNTGLTITRGEEVEITPFVLSATDIDSDDSSIIFELIPPYSTDGKIITRQLEIPDDISNWNFSAGVYEREVTSWSQQDLSEGSVYYRHSGAHTPKLKADRIKFKLMDDNIPPNESDVHEFIIRIIPLDNMAPQPYPRIPLQMTVDEFELTEFNKHRLRYTDAETKDRDLLFRITSKPYDTDKNSPMNPGKLVFTDDPDVEVTEFSQAQINHHKIAYKPPTTELGMVPRIIQFRYNVTDAAGNTLADQEFVILLRPVDNKPPVIFNKGISVFENGFSVLDPDVLDATDEDTDPNLLTFTVIQNPSHGILQLGTMELAEGDIFTKPDLATGIISYVNSGSEANRDSFLLEVTDGVHQIPVSVQVNIRNIDDEAPKFQNAIGTLGLEVKVDEGSLSAITNDLIKASDPDTDDHMITFVIEDLPVHGNIEVNGVISNKFKQEDIENGRVFYVHDGEEVGHYIIYDSFNLTITDMSNDWIIGGNSIERIHVSVAINPVNNAAPQVEVGLFLTVTEGEKSTITLFHLNATDKDSPDESIVCTIIVQPNHGYVENISPAPGSEKRRAGIPLTAFKISDIADGNINYVQSVHKGLEPVEDRFNFICSDGINFSPTTLFRVQIQPTNDEAPEIYMREFVVPEGRDLILDLPILNAVDLDIPKDRLTFFLTKHPAHGVIASHLPTGTTPISNFTLERISKGSNIVYLHDNTETTEDSFDLTVTDGIHNSSKTFIVMIIPVDDETPRLVINDGLEIETGEEKLITNQVLKAEDLDSEDASIIYIVRQPPNYGHLSLLDFSGVPLYNLTQGMNFTQSDIDNGLLKYTHSGHVAESDLIKFDITDGSNPFIDRYFWITVEGIDIIYPDVINKGVELPEGGKVTLNTDTLSTSDLNSDDKFLIFTITRAPTRGHLESTDNPGIPLESFSQLELAGNKIYYVHTSEDEMKMDSFEFEVSDGYNSVFRTFRISISEVDNKKPIVFPTRIKVREGGERLITPFELRVEDRDTSNDRILLTIVREPRRGKLLRGKKKVATTFTMADITANEIAYKHDGSETAEDSFSFTVTDGTHSEYFVHPNIEKETRGPVTIEIEVIPVDNAPPTMETNRGASFIAPLDSGDFGFQFTNKVLRAQDKDSLVSNLLYIVSEQPRHGVLINTKRRNQTVFEFTQGDINGMFIQYILNSSENSTSDAFRFKVVDEGKNELTDQVFELKWAWISIEHEKYVVNETQKFLHVKLKRRGFLGETAFVGIILKNQTAVKGHDFGGIYAQQVQFNPGQNEAQWKIKIFDDPIHEVAETFRFILDDPVVAALEYPVSAEVTILDFEDESTVFIPEKQYEISEGVGEYFIPIKRKGDLSKEMMVVCSTESSSAFGTIPSILQSFSDYITRAEDHTNIIHFLKGDDFQKCRLLIIDDSLYEENESFKVRLTMAMGGKIGKFNETEIVILSDDKDVPSFYFGESEYKVGESDGYVEVSVWRTGTDLSKPASVTVQSRPSEPLSAKAGFDYVGTGRNLDFDPGVTKQTFRVTILDDLGQPVLEGLEDFELVMLMPMNGILGMPNRTTVYINDTTSDVPKFQFKEQAYAVSENISQVHAAVLRFGDAKHAAAVRCYTRQGTAKVTEDFEERPDTDNSLIFFNSGEIEKTCAVNLKEDDIYESNEEFRLFLGSPVSETAGRASIGNRNNITITIKDDNDKPVIMLEQTRYTIKEPKTPGDISLIKIPVLRTGDLSKLSLIRAHTKDGSAKSGIDYVPFSKELEFKPNVSRLLVEIEVLHDGEKEHREAFTLHIRPDRNMVADVTDSKAVIYIQEMDVIADVTFPTRPMIVSLRDYDSPDTAKKNPLPGYPVICITPCNPMHPDFKKTGPLCVKEGISDALTEFRWRVSAPSGQDGVTSDMKDVESTTFFSGTHNITLDSIYFSAGSRIQCSARAVSVEGDAGLELSSVPVTISQTDGLCNPRQERSIGAEPFMAKMRYTDSDDPDYANLIKLTITIPHRDGMLPVISTRKLTNFELTLSPDGLRVGTHKCSNLLDHDEIQTKHGFITNVTRNPNTIGEVEPYQYSTQMRGEPTLRFYSNLDLEACMWEFNSYYDMSELVTDCGGTIATDGQVLNLIQSYVSVRVPLYVSYVFHSPVATGGWQHYDLSSQLRLTFVYDTAILWQRGIGTPEESLLKGHLYPMRMTIGPDGRLFVNFRTEPRFRGKFVLTHPGIAAASTVISPDHPELTFTLELLRSEPTFAQPEQEWMLASDYAIRDYSGIYHIKLIPCTVTEDVKYSDSPQCNPREHVTFDLHVRFQQVSDPVPAEYSLNTELHLMRKRSLWLSNGSMGFGEDSDASFIPGDIVYGRLMMDPTQKLGESFLVNIEKCFLCTGVDGYVPKYHPENNEYGCVADSENLLHAFKIIDKGAPHSVTRNFRNVSFNAILAMEDPEEEVKFLRRQASADGFHFDSSPLFQVSFGRQWFVHCIYTVRSKENAARGIGKRSILEQSIPSHEFWRKRTEREIDDFAVGRNGRGTNMNRLILDYTGKRLLTHVDDEKKRDNGEKHHVHSVNSQNITSEFPIMGILLGITVLALAIALVIISLLHRRKKMPPSHADIIVDNKGNSLIVDHRQYVSNKNNTEV